MISSVKLPLTFNVRDLQLDVEKFEREEWTPHFNTQYYEGDWSGIALRSPKDAHLELYPDPVAESFHDTDRLRRCSYVPSVLESFRCDIESARFLKLGAGSEIKEHRDYKLGYEDGVARLHIPIMTNPQVRFHLDGAPVEMLPGEVWYLNFNLKHSVRNDSDVDRVHLVIDCVLNDWLRSLFARSLSSFPRTGAVCP